MPSPTPTVVPTPTPSPTPGCIGSSNILQDGGFEANTGARTNPNWTSVATTFGSSLCTTGNCGAFARTGNGYVLFDGAASGAAAENANVQQTINIPSGTVATLTFFVRVSSVTAPASSSLTVSVDGTVVQTISEPAAAQPGYTQVNVDLSAFAGGGPRLLSFNYNRPAGTTGSDTFLLDDASLSTSCGSPTVTVGGRVFTPFGIALRNAVVTLTDAQNVRRTATTSSFGLYSFDNIRVGETYILSVGSKRFRFAPQILQFNNSVANLDFVGLE